MTKRTQPPPEPPLQFVEDEAAEPGDVIAALADLLLDLVDQDQGGLHGPTADHQTGRAPAQ